MKDLIGYLKENGGQHVSFTLKLQIILQGTYCIGHKIHIQFRKLLHKALLTRLDVVPDDGDVLVAVGARVLVPEPQRVQELVLDGSSGVALVTPHMQVQLPLPLVVPHPGGAPVTKVT